MSGLNNFPQGATHYTPTNPSRIAGGQYRVYYTFFKLEKGEWKQYVSDTDNEYPQWVSARGCYKPGCFDPDKLLPIGTGEPVVADYVKNLEHRLRLAKQAYERLHQVHLAALEMWRQETEGQYYAKT